jgi:hypothetical protein
LRIYYSWYQNTHTNVNIGLVLVKYWAKPDIQRRASRFSNRFFILDAQLFPDVVPAETDRAFRQAHDLLIAVLSQALGKVLQRTSAGGIISLEL